MRHCHGPTTSCRAATVSRSPVREVQLCHRGIHAVPAGPMVPYRLPGCQLGGQLGGIRHRGDAVCRRDGNQMAGAQTQRGLLDKGQGAPDQQLSLHSAVVQPPQQ